MLGTRLHTFSQFVLEARGNNWNYAGHYASYLNKFAGDSSLLDQVKQLDSQMNHLEDSWWYNREGQSGHYALNMKIHQWPDLEKWAEAKGETDEDEIYEDAMYSDWARFMEDTYEISAEDYANSYDWIEKVGVGGRSGGWLLLYLNEDHAYLEHDLESHFDDYLSNLDQLENPNILADIKRLVDDEADTRELVDLGLIDESDFELAEEVLESRDELENFLNEKLQEFNQIESDLEDIQANIDKFKKTAEEDFYDWLRNS
jgi:hypothetical protein